MAFWTLSPDGQLTSVMPARRLYGAALTEDPAAVAGCRKCLEIVADDQTDLAEHMGRCIQCRSEVRPTGGVAWVATAAAR